MAKCLGGLAAVAKIFLALVSQGCEIYSFPCGRWLARGEEDGALERELVPDRIVSETTRKDGSLKRKEKDTKHGLTGKPVHLPRC